MIIAPWLSSPVGCVVVLLVIGLLNMRRIIRQIWQLPRVALKQFASDILRLAFLLTRPRRLAQKGFVLPTTVLLTIMVALTVTALTYRTFVRSEQAIGQREQKVIVNAATPAIDRAKAKIEFLFQSENIPYLPSSDELYDRMSTRLSAGRETRGYGGNVDLLNGGFDPDKVDPYTLADETRLDINGDGVLDNAWAFKSEGKTLVYSILVDNKIVASDANSTDVKLGRPYVSDALSQAGSLLTPGVIDIKDRVSQGKANALVTRTGPLATTEVSPQCEQRSSSGEVAGDWQVVNQAGSSTLQKNFQINAFVTDINKDIDKTFETLEFQQSRKAARANKWGAWFRYDLEIPLGSQPFNWNGAMHTDSNLIINNRGAGALNLYMVSSPASCVYSRDSSEITLGGTGNFQGQAIKGSTRDDDYGLANPTIHVFDGDRVRPRTGDQLTNGNHSVEGGRPSDISVNALKLFTEDTLEHMRAAGAGIWNRRPAWDTADNIFGGLRGGRLINNEVDRPIIDDFYRADNRWGPKPRYDNNQNTPLDIPPDTTIGEDIVGNQYDRLTEKNEGLDGFWERQAIQKGLRLIIGQRLELGNANGWGLPPSPPSGSITPPPPAGDSLYPANSHKSTLPLAATNTAIGGDHEYLQRKALRDNLAAVQGMVVYHYEEDNGEFPAACVALTAHPGTRQAIVDSRSFGTWLSGDVKTDFLNGKGTNGWEFEFFNRSAFTSLPGGTLGNALQNLAYFAGDPDGGAPSFKPVQDTQGANAVVHPFPYMAMWGDFSPLRRIFDDYFAQGVSYANLSPADQATLHSAACSLGMLAYNLKSVEDEFQYLNNPAGFDTPAGPTTLAAVADLTGPATAGTPEAFAEEALRRWGQVNRDRQYGFAQPTTGGTTCDSNEFTGIPTTDTVRRNALANKFCLPTQQPKYPSLFYLFRKVVPGGVPPQPATEDYIRESSGPNGYIARVNGGFTYTPVDPGDIDLQPRALNGSNWVLPVTPTTGRIDPNTLENNTANANGNAFKINTGTTGVLQVAFLDKGIYDGREQLNTRVLDIDLDALTTQTVGTDYWLSADLDRDAEGIVYAFREYAVREY